MPQWTTPGGELPLLYVVYLRSTGAVLVLTGRAV
jgi:hypothetical protein